MAEEKKPAPTGAPDSKLMAALSYLWILSIIMLAIKKDDDFVKFHAKQGLVIFIFSLIGIIPFLWFISWLIWIITVILVIIGFIKAYNGERFKIPVVGDIANKF